MYGASKQIIRDKYEKERPYILQECIDSLSFMFFYMLTYHIYL